MSAGFASNMPMDQGQERTLMLPADGGAQEEELLASFARLSIRRTKRFPELVEEMCAYSGMDILVLSRYDSDSLQRSLEELRQCGNQVTFHVLEGGAR